MHLIKGTLTHTSIFWEIFFVVVFKLLLDFYFIIRMKQISLFHLFTVAITGQLKTWDDLGTAVNVEKERI